MDIDLGCSCGANAGDEGILFDHLFDNPDHDPKDRTLELPEQVMRARQNNHRRQNNRQKLAEKLGMSIEEVREAIR